jgi:hypothetical protein
MRQGFHLFGAGGDDNMGSCGGEVGSAQSNVGMMSVVMFFFL